MLNSGQTSYRVQVQSLSSIGTLASIDTGLRDSVRVALRQLRHIDGESVALARWREAYD